MTFDELVRAFESLEGTVDLVRAAVASVGARVAGLEHAKASLPPRAMEMGQAMYDDLRLGIEARKHFGQKPWKRKDGGRQVMYLSSVMVGMAGGFEGLFANWEQVDG